MKTIKYLIASAMMLGLSTSVMAQDNGYKAALKPIISALEAAPDNPLAGKDLIKNYQKQYKKDEAALVALGNVFLAQHDFARATEMANLVTNNKRMNGSLAYLLLGDIAALKDSIGNAGTAATQYQLAIDLDPRNYAAYERYARVYRRVNPKLAIDKLQELRTVNPKYPVEATAAEIMLKDGKYAEAIEWYDKGNRDYFTEDNFYNYGFVCYINRKYTKAMEVVQAGLKKFPGSEYISRIGLMAAVEKEDYTDALNFAKVVFAGSGKKVSNDYVVYARALLGNKQYDEALANLNKAMEMDNNNFNILKVLAEVYFDKGDQDKALEYEQEYLAKNSKATSADWARLAQTYIAKAEKIEDTAERNSVYSKAMDVYESMIAKFPSISDWIWLNQANVANMMNDPDKVVELYIKVAAYEEAKTELDDESKSYLESVYYGLGYYNSKKGNKQLANEYYNKVLKINPDNQNAKQALGL